MTGGPPGILLARGDGSRNLGPTAGVREVEATRCLTTEPGHEPRPLDTSFGRQPVLTLIRGTAGE